MLDDFTITAAELARLGGVHRKTIYQYIRTGKVKAKRFGSQYRIRASEVERVLGIRPIRPERQQHVA